MPSMLERRKDPRGVVAIRENFYIVDGLDYHWTAVDGPLLQWPDALFRSYAEKYNPSQQAWQRLPHKLGPQPLDFVSVNALDDFLYLIGGKQIHADWSGTAISMVQRFDTRNDQWE